MPRTQLTEGVLPLPLLVPTSASFSPPARLGFPARRGVR
ncbi:MAG: hypothetical protein QOF35_2068 [Actinomycetota bacterium]|nr:hypothetical protein [Actinomycetota bacterium]